MGVSMSFSTVMPSGTSMSATVMTSSWDWIRFKSNLISLTRSSGSPSISTVCSICKCVPGISSSSTLPTATSAASDRTVAFMSSSRKSTWTTSPRVTCCCISRTNTVFCLPDTSKSIRLVVPATLRARRSANLSIFTATGSWCCP